MGVDSQGRAIPGEVPKLFGGELVKYILVGIECVLPQFGVYVSAFLSVRLQAVRFLSLWRAVSLLLKRMVMIICVGLTCYNDI